MLVILIANIKYKYNISIYKLYLFSGTQQGIHERRLLEDIFGPRKYNQFERPVANESDALVVYFGLTLQQIISVVY